MNKKIVIVLLIFTLCIGAVSAVEIGDIKLPSDFKAEGTNYAVHDSFEIGIKDYSDSDKDILFKNDTGYTVIVSDISNYTDDTAKHVGCLEIVKVNDKNVVIECYSENTDAAKCYEYMTEINNLNSFTPVTP